MLYAILVLILAVLLFGSSAVIGAIGAVLGMLALFVGLAMLAMALASLTGLHVQVSFLVVFLGGIALGFLAYLVIRHFERKRGLR